MPARFGSVLRQSDFRYLVSTTTIDALGVRLTHMLLIALVAASQPGEIFAYAQGSMIVGLPPILLAPFIGVLVDRWNRRNTLFVTHLVQTGLLLLAPVLFMLTGSLIPAWLILFTFFAADVFKNSSAPALLPAIVPPENTLVANSLWYAFARAATVIGMIFGGYLVKLTGWQASFAVNGVVHLVAGLLLLGISNRPAFHPVPATQDLGTALARSGHKFFQELVAVLRLIISNRYVAFVMFTVVAALGITGIAYTLLAYIVQQVMGLGTAGVGIYSGIMAAGMLGGSILIGIFADRIRRTRLIIFGLAAIGLLLLIGPWLVNRWFVGIIALIAGGAFSGIGIAQTTVLQTRVAAEAQGRIFATREFFGNVMFLATTLLLGITSLIASYQLLLVLSGVTLLLFCLLGWLLVRNLEDAPAAV